MADYVMMEQQHYQQHEYIDSELLLTEYDEGLQVPPLDPFYFPENCRDVTFLPDPYHAGVDVDDDFAFDYTLDDLFGDEFFGDSFLADDCMPDSADRICVGEERIGIEHSPVSSQSSVDRKPDAVKVLDEIDCSRSVRVTTSSGEDDKVFHVVSENCCYSGDGSSNSARVSNSHQLGCEGAAGAGGVTVTEPVSSHGSGNCGSVSEARDATSTDSGNCELDVSSNSVVADHKAVKLEDKVKPLKSKRKKESHDGSNESHRSSKFRKSDTAVDSGTSNVGDEEGDDKRKARLIRNRESAQLSRQRRKHYVEELEGKLKVMHSTVQDLNNKISYFMAENATLRHQLSGGGNGMCPTPQPGMYPYPPMTPMGAYPWMPAPYMVKPHGSQVPLVPIPRLKPQPPVSAPKSKKLDKEKKRSDGKSKVKKVASFSFMGLLLFLLLFGIVVPMIDVNYEDDIPNVSSDVGHKLNTEHLDRILRLKAHSNESDYSVPGGVSSGKVEISSQHREGRLSENSSEPLVASLYVPRNDKLVKIDGNLIIQSVLASEKAKESRRTPEAEKTEDPGCENARNLPMPYVGKRPGSSYIYRNPSGQRALISSSADNLNGRVKSSDGNMHQWFREGLAGPMLSSGMCTEVFHFDVLPGAIIPAPPVANKSTDHHRNSTTADYRVKNRRFLGRLPVNFNESALNITNDQVGRSSSQNNSFEGNNKSISSTIVSVLVDPREVGDGDTDGMMGPKSLSRIFVVVLLDSVKYVTYSCMLPLKGSTGPHLVTLED